MHQLGKYVMQTSEQELIAQSLAENTSAYGQLVDRYKTSLYYHCFAIVRNEDTAKDIAQDTFISAYYKLDSFDQSRKFSTWLFKIATNRALNYLRDNKRVVPIGEETLRTLPSQEKSPDVAMEHTELHNAIAKLQPNYRAIIHLFYFEGMSYKQIAETLNKPEGSIKGWMSRAKRALRKELI